MTMNTPRRDRQPVELGLAADFAQALDDAIHDLDVSNAAFGERVRMTHDAIGKYRKGIREPGIGKALLLAREAGLSLDALINQPQAPQAEVPAGLPLDELVDPPTRRRGRGTSAP